MYGGSVSQQDGDDDPMVDFHLCRFEFLKKVPEALAAA